MITSRRMAILTLGAALAAIAAAEKPKAPACRSCGSTCGLEPICVCEPGTKKKPKVEFGTECEPVCIPGCGSRPWPWGDRHPGGGCTSCCDEPCRCPGRVRSCKRLTKTTVDEEVPVIERRVEYVCAACASGGRPSCCAPPAPRPRGWWASLHSWWSPRSP